LDLNLDFDIQEDIDEQGKQILKYLINQKPVDKDVFYKLKQDRKENMINNHGMNHNMNQNLNPEEYTDCDCDCEGQGVCFNCAIRDLVSELRECDDNEAVEIILEFIDGVEQDSFETGISEGITLGIKNICRNLVEQLNHVIYTDIEVNIGGNQDMENEWDDE